MANRKPPQRAENPARLLIGTVRIRKPEGSVNLRARRAEQNRLQTGGGSGTIIP